MEEAIFHLGEFAYFPILIGSGLAIITCMLAGPRGWSRSLCRYCLWASAVFLLSAMAYLTWFAVATGLRDEGGFGFGLLLMFCFPIAVEFLCLLAVWFFWVAPSSR